MKKLFNIRPFFIILLFFAGGIILGAILKISPQLFLPVSIATGAVLILSLLILIIKKSKKSTAVFLCLIFLLAGFGVFNLDIKKHEQAYLDEDAQITGTVTDKIYTSGNIMTFFIRDVVLTRESVSTPLPGYTRVKIPLEDLPADLRAGDKVEFLGHITSAEIFSEGTVYTYYYKNDIKYIIKNNSVSNLNVQEGTASLTENIRSSVKDTLYKTVGKDDGSILYALLFGDKTDMNADTKDAFIESGIIHIFAVSGLHVGFLSAAVLWILEKLKVRRTPAFVLQLAVFILYAMLCDFAPSVMRAAIMALVLQLGNLLFRRYDLLSSMSFSALLILTFRPLLLFDTGFLLTYGCVFGIVTIMPFFEKALIRLPKFLRTPLAMSFSVQIALLPMSAYFFGGVSLFGVLLNIFAVPLIGVCFIFLFASVILSGLFAFLSPLIFLPNFGVSALRFASDVVVSSGIATISIASFGLLALGFYLVMYIGKFMLVKRDKKAALCVGLTLVFLASTLIANLPVFNKESLSGQSTLTAIQYEDSSAAVITTKQDNTFLVLTGGNREILTGLKTVGGTYGISAFDAVILTEVTASSAAAFEEVLSAFSVHKLILPYTENMNPADAVYYVQLERLNVETVYTDDIDYLNNLEVDGISLRYLGSGQPLALSLRADDTNILFANNMTSAELSFAFSFVPAEPVLIVANENFDRILVHFHNALVIYGNRMYNYFDTYETTETSAYALTLKISDGKISVKKRF